MKIIIKSFLFLRYGCIMEQTLWLSTSSTKTSLSWKRWKQLSNSFAGLQLQWRNFNTLKTVKIVHHIQMVSHLEGFCGRSCRRDGLGLSPTKWMDEDNCCLRSLAALCWPYEDTSKFYNVSIFDYASPTGFDHSTLPVLSRISSQRPAALANKIKVNLEQCFSCFLIPTEAKFSLLAAAACFLDPTVGGELRESKNFLMKQKNNTGGGWVG